MNTSTIKQACKIAKVSHTTAYKWINDPNFNIAYKQLRRDIMKGTTTKLQGATQKAVETLVNILDDTNAPAIAKVRSAKTILEYAFKSMELEDLEERIEMLEQKQERKIID